MREYFLMAALLAAFSVEAAPANPAELAQLDGKWQVCSWGSAFRNFYNCREWERDGDVFKFFSNTMTIIPIFNLNFEAPKAKNCWVDMRGVVSSVERIGRVSYDHVRGTAFAIRYTYDKMALVRSAKSRGNCAAAIKLANAKQGEKSDELRVIVGTDGRNFWDVSPGKVKPKILRRLTE